MKNWNTNFSTEKEEIAKNVSKLANSNSNLKEKLDTTMQANTDLENSLKIAKTVIDERFNREKEALGKVQEALFVAELAIAEKEKAIYREKIVREECDQLAETIGQVIEEAAQKVEKNVEYLKLQYEEQIRNLENSCKEVKCFN